MEIAYDIGYMTPTYVIGDDKTCGIRGCDGFDIIECE